MGRPYSIAAFDGLLGEKGKGIARGAGDGAREGVRVRLRECRVTGGLVRMFPLVTCLTVMSRRRTQRTVLREGGGLSGRRRFQDAADAGYY